MVHKHKNLQEKIRSFLNTKNIHDWHVRVAVLGAILILVMIGAYFVFFSKNNQSFQKDDDAISAQSAAVNDLPISQACPFRFALGGTCSDEAQIQNGQPKVFAVMFDNHPDARPQTNLADATLVYEAPVEGNFTRFMGLYPVGEITLDKIGPVRSARPYYVDWLGEYGTPVYVHVGGSPDALDLITRRDIFDFNEFSKGWYFWRDKARYAPHNTYTSTELIEQGITDFKQDMTDGYESFIYGDIAACEKDCVSKIHLEYLPPSFVVDWQYNTSTQKYERTQGYKKHVDADGEQVLADVVIVQRVAMKTVDAAGRKEIVTIGSGDAMVFQRGTQIAGTWKKESVNKKTRFYDAEGNEITMQSGKMWIQVLATGMEMSVE